MAKPKAHEWKERTLEDWNATTFRAYVRDRHEEIFGIPYTPRNVKMEAAMLKRLIDAHGQAIVKAFIDTCMENYRPTPTYPGINIAFMVAYMKDRYLPPLLLEKKKQEHLEKVRKMAKEKHRADLNKTKSFEDWI